MFAPLATYRPPTRLACRIVFVGASTTALTALRHMALARDFAAPHVTLVTPGGAAAAAAAAAAAGAPALAAAVMDGSVTVVDATMVAIDQCGSIPASDFTLCFS